MPAYVYVRALARTHRLLGCRLYPWVFQFPGVLRARQMGGGDARWRQPRTPAPASRCSTARPGEWRGGQGWSGLARPGLARTGRAAHFSQEAERLRDPGTDWGRTVRRARRRVEEPAAWSPGPETEETQTWGLWGARLGSPLGDQPVAGALWGLGPELTPTPDWVPGALVEHGTCPPALCPERARARFPAPAQAQCPASVCRCCISRAVLFCLPQTGSALRAGTALTHLEAGHKWASVIVGRNPFQPFSSSWE